jgi:hypothetical protein
VAGRRRAARSNVKRWYWSLVFLIGIGMLWACRAEQQPVQVLREFLAATQELDIAQAETLVCEAQRDRVRTIFEPFDRVSETGEAFDIEFNDLAFQERGNDGSVALVHISGTLTVSFLGRQEQQDVDEEHIVVKENGRWVICDP